MIFHSIAEFRKDFSDVSIMDIHHAREMLDAVFLLDLDKL